MNFITNLFQQTGQSISTFISSSNPEAEGDPGLKKILAKMGVDILLKMVTYIAIL